MKRVKRKPGLTGPTGLLTSIICQATNDAIGAHNQKDMLDALAYFHGDFYRHHVTALGLSPNMIPAALKNPETLERIIDVVLMPRQKTGEYYEWKKRYEIQDLDPTA